MKKLSYLIVLALILGLVLTGCLLSNVGQVPTSEQSGITYLTKNGILDPDIVGLWHFDEGSGTIANDSSGNVNTGTLELGTLGNTITASAWVGDQWGGQALKFDGLDDYVNCGKDVSLDITQAITIEAWVKPYTFPTDPNYSTIATKVRAYYFHIDSSGYLRVYQYGTSSPGYHSSSNPILLNVWQHVAYTYDGSNVRFFINGVLDNTIAVEGTISVSSEHLGIGMNLDASGDPFPNCYRQFQGEIDEVRIWNTAIPSFNLNVEPELDFNPVGTNHTVTATVTISKEDGGTEPAPGVLVDFAVDDGTNITIYSDYTDKEGVATFNYTRNDAGMDTITAEINEAPYAYVFDEVTKYWLENFVTGGGKINMSTLYLNGKKAALTFGGTVGVLEGVGIVGQFHIVDHTGLIHKGAESWHCNNDFSFLNFEGGPAESPEATHDTAIFEGDFVSNRGNTKTLRLRIIDNGEPGARVDTFSILSPPEHAFAYDIEIDGGNFQVHNIDNED